MRESELTFLIQGPEAVDGERNRTVELVASLHSAFPESGIVYASSSAWKGRYPERCRLVTVPDPGEFDHAGSRFLRNLKRQQASTLTGLCAVDTTYVMKLRSDTRIEPERLRTRLLRGDVVEREHDSRVHLFYHSAPLKLFMLDDRVQFGRTDAVRRFWSFDAQQVIDGPLPRRLRERTFANRVFALNRNDGWNLAPEQVIALKTVADLPVGEGLLRWTELYLRLIADRFVPHHTRDFGILSHKWAMPDHIGVRAYLWLIDQSANVRTRALIWMMLSALRSGVTAFKAQRAT